MGGCMEYFNEESYDWRLSNCCQFHNKELAKKYNFNTCTRTYALAEGGKEKVLTRALGNAKKLELAMNEYYAKQPKEKRSFRVSTNMFPVYTWPAITPWFKEIEEELSIAMKKAGDAAKKHQVRLSVHPGQYTVMASTSKDVVEKSIVDLEYHALLGQMLGLEPEDFSVNIHLQGLYGGKHEDGIKRFASNYQYLSDYAQKCLSVENEDKPNGYDIVHTLELAQRIPIRCTLDTHHYDCHRMVETERVKVGEKQVNRKVREVDSITATSDLFKEAVKSWKGIRPLFHTSQSFPPENQAYWMKCNAHSDIFWDEEHMSRHVPMLQYADFDVEAKNKEVAVDGFYDYIMAESDFAGELLQAKRIPNDW